MRKLVLSAAADVPSTDDSRSVRKLLLSVAAVDVPSPADVDRTRVEVDDELGCGRRGAGRTV